MRSRPSCWNSTLAKLGFKRSFRRPGPKGLPRRRHLFENLEPRRLLSGDGWENPDIVEATTVITSSLLAATSDLAPDSTHTQKTRPIINSPWSAAMGEAFSRSPRFSMPMAGPQPCWV